MKGEKTNEFLKENEEREKELLFRLRKVTGKRLANIDEEWFGDFKDLDTDEYYEVKYDPHMGKSGNVMIELFASIQRDNFEKGWGYRYRDTHYLVFYNDNYIYIYKCRELLDYFWNRMRKDKICNFNMHHGVILNPDVVLILLKEEEVKEFLKDKYETHKNT